MNHSQESQGEKPKIRRGLVLEGGGAKGAWQFGALRALKENGVKFDYVAGTSVGALNGALWAAGRMDIGTELWGALSRSKVFKLRLLHSPLFLVGIFARIFYAYVRGLILPKDAHLIVRIFLYSLMGLPTIVATIYILIVLIRVLSAVATQEELWRILLVALVMVLSVGGLVLKRKEVGRKHFFFYTSLFALIGLICHLLPYVIGSDTRNLNDHPTPKQILGDVMFNTAWEMPILLWSLGVVPFVIFGIAKFLRQLNTSLLSAAPLEGILKKLVDEDSKFLCSRL